MRDHDNPQAFPTPESEHMHHVAGMSLRDYYAAKALHGLSGTNWQDETALAETCFRIADAMLAERSKQ